MPQARYRIEYDGMPYRATARRGISLRVAMMSRVTPCRVSHARRPARIYDIRLCRIT